MAGRCARPQRRGEAAWDSGRTHDSGRGPRRTASARCAAVADGWHLPAFAGSAQTLQALCGDCHSEKTLRESAQPTNLESRVAQEASNGYRPIHDAWTLSTAAGASWTRRRAPGAGEDGLPLTQRLPKRFTERLRALEAPRHPDGTPVYHVEETKPLLGSRPVGHCLAGNFLLLTALPGTGKTARIVVRLRARRAHLVSKTHCSAQNLGLGAQTVDRRREVPAASAVVGRAGLRAGRPISAPLERFQAGHNPARQRSAMGLLIGRGAEPKASSDLIDRLFEAAKHEVVAHAVMQSNDRAACDDLCAVGSKHDCDIAGLCHA